MASKFGHPDVLRVLLKLGADPRVKGEVVLGLINNLKVKSILSFCFLLGIH